MIDLQAFARDPDLDLSEFEGELVDGAVTTWLLGGGNWVAGFMSGDVACYIIGGPTCVDPRVFSTLSSALAAVAIHLGLKLAKDVGLAKVRAMKIIKPEQILPGKGRYYLKVLRAPEPTFLAAGPDGPFGPIFRNWIDASNAAYDSAASDQEL